MISWQKSPPNLKDPWLTKPYVLSEHLRASAENYQFKLLEQHISSIASEESRLLTDQKSAWVRTCCHCSGTTPLVFGRVVVPPETYQAYSEEFGDLKTNPIGETLLFGNREVRRGPFEYAEVTKDDPAFAFCFESVDAEVLLARRSLFYWRGLPLLVIEVFTPDMPEFIPQKNLTQRSYRVREKLLDIAYLIRLHRPIPILLMFWPTFWALWMASGGLPKVEYMVIFALGVFFMRSCGDVLNDLADRGFDGAVERTRMRPLATGRISVKEALLVALVFAALSFVLVLFLNPLTIGLAFVGMGLAIIYPFMKRFTSMPQLVLGFAYNWGVIMAFSAVQNTVPPVAWLLWLSTIAWTIAYDTFYAMADCEHDWQVGIKSTAVLFGRYVHQWIGAFQLLALVLWISVGWVMGFGFYYYFAIILSLFLFIYEHVKLYQKVSISRAIWAFNHNHWVGLLIFLGISIQFL